jgi:flagellar hook-associated protein 1 FlgK
MGNIALMIAGTGIDAQQAAMDTVAENLANANTPGYIQESPTLQATGSFDRLGAGAGVTTLGASQALDGLLVVNNQQAVGALAQTSSLQQVLQGVQSAFPVSTTSGVASDLSSFWQSWDAVSQNPSSQSDRANVVNTAQTVITDLASASNEVASSQADAQSQLGSLTSSDNSLLSQVAALNTQIVVTEGSGASPNSLVDQQNQIMGQLAQDMGAVGTAQPNGTINVAIAGVNVVQGNTAATVGVSGTSPPLGLTILTGTPSTPAGTAIPATAGTVAGLLAAVNQYLPAFQTQLDTVANDLASTVNGQLASGYTASGTAGTPLFQGSGAAGLSLNPTIVGNPQLIAASATATEPDATNNGANAQAMANLYSVAGGPDQAYQSFIQTMGSQISGISSQVQTQTSVANAAQQNLQAVSGVDTNSQMVLMLNYQQAYQASAKVISTVDTMMQSLLQAT